MTSSDIDKIIKQITKKLRAGHDPVRAVNEKKYLKSPYKFYGIKIPALRKMAKEILKEYTLTRKNLFALSGSLWQSDWHQHKTMAIMLLVLSPEYMDIKAMPMLERMCGECVGWDHLDALATGAIAEVLTKDSAAFDRLIKLSHSPNHWVRRASLLSQIPLLRKGGGDRELFFRLADGMLKEKEFFIRKAIGWTVRELGKADAAAARDYLLSIKGRASALTIREGAKRLPDIMREEVLSAKD